MNGFSGKTLAFAVFIVGVFGVFLGVVIDRSTIHLQHKVLVSDASAKYAYEPDLKPTDEQVSDCQAGLATLQEYLFRDAAKAGDRANQITFDNLSRDNSIFIQGWVEVGERRPGAFSNFCEKSKMESAAESLHMF